MGTCYHGSSKTGHHPDHCGKRYHPMSITSYVLNFNGLSMCRDYLLRSLTGLFPAGEDYTDERPAGRQDDHPGAPTTRIDMLAPAWHRYIT